MGDGADGAAGQAHHGQVVVRSGQVASYHLYSYINNKCFISTFINLPLGHHMLI